MEDSFSTDGGGVGFWMIQVHYNDCAPFFSFVAISGYPALTSRLGFVFRRESEATADLAGGGAPAVMPVMGGHR